MKNFKNIIILSSLILLNSCQSETTETEEEVSSSKLIDQTYAKDLIFYKDIPIVYENSEYTIEEVLTDSALFDYYVNANSHYFIENDDKSVLYVTPEDLESAEVMIAKIKENSRSQKTAATQGAYDYDFIAKFSKHVGNSGGTYTWEKEGSSNSNAYNTVVRNYNFPTWIKNEISSLRFSRSIGSGLSKGVLRVYKGESLGGTSTNFPAAINVNNISDYNVGNDDIESVAFLVTAY